MVRRLDLGVIYFLDNFANYDTVFMENFVKATRNDEMKENEIVSFVCLNIVQLCMNVYYYYYRRPCFAK